MGTCTCTSFFGLSCFLLSSLSYLVVTSSSIDQSSTKFIPLWWPQFLPQETEIWHGGQVCVCVYSFLAHLLKGGVIVGVAYCKKVQNFQMDSQTRKRLSIGHEPKDN